MIPIMLRDILARIDERLEEVGLSESRAAKLAGLSDSAIRDIRRVVKAGKEDAGVSTRTLAKLAPVLRTTMEWLLTGGEESVGTRTVAVMGYVGAGAEVSPEFEQVPPEGLEQVELPFSLDEDLIAFRVKGDSMLPIYKHDATIVVYREQKRPLETFYGEEAAVRTEDGRRFVKTIMRGDGNTVHLISSNAPPIENVRLAWIGEIFATLPPSAVRKAARQGGVQGQLRLRAG
jgi:phage repressor protein C with HTH and peptisase S24 domain